MTRNTKGHRTRVAQSSVRSVEFNFATKPLSGAVNNIYETNVMIQCELFFGGLYEVV